MDRFSTPGAPVALVTMLVLIGLSSSGGRSNAEPVTPAFVATNIEWTAAAEGGIGGGSRQGGTGTIALTGVTGSARQAVLYWHGIDNFMPRTERTSLDARSSVPGSVKYLVADAAARRNLRRLLHRAHLRLQMAARSGCELAGAGEA